MTLIFSPYSGVSFAAALMQIECTVKWQMNAKWQYTTLQRN